MTDLEKYEKIVSYVANSFARTSHHDVEELIGESFLAYCEARKSFIPGKSACLSTWIFICVKNHLISWTQKQPFSLGGEIDFEIPSDNMTDRFEFLEGLKTMSRDAQNICQMIFENPPPTFQKAEITVELRKRNWSYKCIWASMKEIKLHLQEE